MANINKERETSRQVFENIKNYTQLDPSIVRGITLCVQSAFEGGVTNEDTLHHMQGDIVMVDIDTMTHEVLAFGSVSFGTPNELLNSNDISNVYGCYLAGTTVSKEAQGTGFYKKMSQTIIDIAINRKLELVFTRTQNPRIQAGIQAAFKKIQEKGQIAGFTLERKLVPGYYGRILTKTKPYDHEISFEELNYEKGDAYVLLFSLKYKV